MNQILYISILLLPILGIAQQRKYNIKTIPACWKVEGKADQSVTRVFLMNSEGTLLLSDYDSLGNAITISGGYLTTNFCGCTNPSSGVNNNAVDNPNSSFAIKTDAVCWTTSGVDSTIIRYYLMNPNGVLSVNNYNASGQSVTISGGSLKMGYCECQD